MNLKELSKLNVENEELLDSAKLWITNALNESRSSSKATLTKISTKRLPISYSSPPSNARILESYTNVRLRIHHSNSSVVSS